jgi:hypothetical protein
MLARAACVPTTFAKRLRSPGASLPDRSVPSQS